MPNEDKMIISRKNKHQINCKLRQLIGQSVSMLRKQNYFGLIVPNFIHIKFDNDTSIFVSNFMRITQKNKMLLSSCDEEFSTHYIEVPIKTDEEVLNDNNLLNLHIKEVSKLLKDKCVINAKLSSFGDLSITFEGNIKICAFIDTRLNGEYLRIITGSEHFVFFFEDGTPQCIKEYCNDYCTE